MLEQTKRTIETMKKAGFKRSEFRARVEVTRRNGGTEYGAVRIFLKVRFDPIAHSVETLADGGLLVTQFVGFNEDRSKMTFQIEYGYRGKFQVCDFTEKDENGFQIYHMIYKGQ